MDQEQAEQAAQTSFFRPFASLGGECDYIQPRVGPSRVLFMTTSGVIARVDVSRRNVATRAGIRVGDSERRVYRAYGSKIRLSRHVYVRGGHYLTVVPRSPSEFGKRIIFETNGRYVTEIRAGRLPEVRYIEGCA